MAWLIPAIAGGVAVIVMTLVLRRSRFFGLPETQMIRAIGSWITKDYKSSLKPGFAIHFLMGIGFAYLYSQLLATAPTMGASAGIGFWDIVVVCTLIGVVHGLLVTLFLVIAVAQYHPVSRFQRLGPGDMGSHVIGHIVYGFTVGILLAWLPKVFGG